MNTRALPPGSDNPSRNGMVMDETFFKTESEAQRPINMESARSWIVMNPSVHNALGQPNQSKGGDGLPRWVSNSEPIENQDVVVCYTVGLTHIPRPEEWPVMSATHIGFKLVPSGFFSKNPALDVP